MGRPDPQYVMKTYQYLLTHEPSTAIFLHCCGAPAEWAGDEEKHQEVIDRIRKDWRDLGEPTIILACPRCNLEFLEYLPEIPVRFIYDFILEYGISHKHNSDSTKYSVFDPCTSRNQPGLRDTIRKLADMAGYELEPLPNNEECPKCCGYGGQPAIANPKFADFVKAKRISESKNPYIAYCINCRDIFALEGKQVVHILDILFSIRKTDSLLPTVSERRQNRYELKRMIAKEFWQEEFSSKMPSENEKRIIISPELRKRLSAERILETDIKDVILFCERTGRKVIHPETGHLSGYSEIGYMTYWVEYKIREDGFELISFYPHRMKIDLEVVWNGKRTDADL